MEKRDSPTYEHEKGLKFWRTIQRKNVRSQNGQREQRTARGPKAEIQRNVEQSCKASGGKPVEGLSSDAHILSEYFWGRGCCSVTPFFVTIKLSVKSDTHRCIV